MRSQTTRRNDLEQLKKFLKEVESLVNVVLVEGARDVQALRRLGFDGEIVTCGVPNVNDFDLMSSLSGKYKRILILTDFDQEGLEMNNNFSSILEHQDIIVEKGLRREFGRLTAALNVYAIESLDNLDYYLSGF